MDSQTESMRTQADDLYSQVFSLRGVLSAESVDVDSTNFLESLQACYANLQSILSAEISRLGSLAQSRGVQNQAQQGFTPPM